MIRTRTGLYDLLPERPQGNRRGAAHDVIQTRCCFLNLVWRLRSLAIAFKLRFRTVPVREGSTRTGRVPSSTKAQVDEDRDNHDAARSQGCHSRSEGTSEPVDRNTRCISLADL